MKCPDCSKEMTEGETFLINKTLRTVWDCPTCQHPMTITALCEDWFVISKEQRDKSLKSLQAEIYDNKKRRGFNTLDIAKEIVLLTEELGELARAYKQSNQGQADLIDNRENIADAIGDIIVLSLGLCEILKIDSEKLLFNIVDNNKTRQHSGSMKEIIKGE